MRASDFINLIEHALGGAPDSRLDPLMVVNQAGSFVTNLHDWKFRKRPPLDVTFQLSAAPTSPPILTIVRATNVVTLTLQTAPVPPLAVGGSIIVADVTDTTFNGTFTIATVISEVQVTYAQTAADASDNSGKAGSYVYEQFIDLPADFGELLAVCTTNNAIGGAEMVSLPTLAWFRGSPIRNYYKFWYRCALSFPQQATVDDSQPGPRLEVWPRPQASQAAGDLTLTYRGGWIDLVYPGDDSDASDTTPNLPPKFDRLLVLISRLFAQGYEEEQTQEDPSCRRKWRCCWKPTGGRTRTWA